MSYQTFLESKSRRADQVGFEPQKLNPNLFDWQADVTTWGCRIGRTGCFAGTGLGKTIMQLAWAEQVCKYTNGNVLILCPLAVAQQSKREADKFQIETPVKVCKERADVEAGISLLNYERLHKIEAAEFSGIVLDESSILKSMNGATRTALIDLFRNTPYKLCCSATPAPNDHTELGNHSEFLNVMRRPEMLATFFVHDSSRTQNWRLKRHAINHFWKWVASWAVAVDLPSDLGYKDDGFVLPELRTHEHVIDVGDVAPEGFLFSKGITSATGVHAEKRSTTDARAAAVAEIVSGETSEPWVIWCDTDYESAALSKAIPEALEIRGSHTVEKKESAIEGFANGEHRIIISKPSITGYGLNWQHCHHTCFVGLSYSFEKWYQAVRRLWRFGQKSPVECHVISTEGEYVISEIVREKEAKHKEMKTQMMRAMKGAQMENLYGVKQVELEQPSTVKMASDEGWPWRMYRGDACEVIKDLPDESIHYSIFSPPFVSLYSYTDSPRDMGNSRDYDEFFTHFEFVAKELLRILVPGRLCSVHCFQLPRLKQVDGWIGIRDFRGDIIRLFEKCGFYYHCEVAIRKDPLVSAVRTKALRLAHKQICKDSTMCGQDILDYVETFRKPGENPEAVSRKRGFEEYHGAGEPIKGKKTDEPRKNKYSHQIWQRYAEPVWTDIDQTKVLRNYREGRDEKDERHLCPLQTQTIERCVELWTNPEDIVFSPFAGIGSEGHGALLQGRRFVGIELKESYWKIACKNLARAEEEYKEKKRELF